MGLYPSGYREERTGESSWRAPRMALFPYCCSARFEPCRDSFSRSQATCRWQECSGDAYPPVRGDWCLFSQHRQKRCRASRASMKIR